MPLILPGNVASATAAVGYNVANSCRFNDGDSPRMYKAGVTGTSRDAWTTSVWVKRGNVTTEQRILTFSGTDSTSAVTNIIKFNADDSLLVVDNTDGSNNHIHIQTSRLFRDPSAWYHIVVAVDSGQGTEANRVKIYINGTQETSFSDETYLAEDADTLMGIGSGYEFVLSSWKGNNNQYFDGYLAEVVHIDGLQLAATSFGEFDEDSPTIWKPIDVSELTFGNNGFYLDFEASDNLGNDANGGTDLTETNLAAADQATDTPTNNFATLNPVYASRFDNDGLLSEGNNKITFTAANADTGFGMSTMGVTAGKWYWEIKLPTIARAGAGVGDATRLAAFTATFWDSDPSYAFQVSTYDGKINENNASTSYANAASDDDIVMFALDMDNHRCWYGINGTWQDSGDPTSGATGTGDVTTQISDQTHINTGEFMSPFVIDGSTSGQSAFEMNFGGCPAFAISSAAADGNGYGAFEYAPPSGFLALCSKNLGSSGG